MAEGLCLTAAALEHGRLGTTERDAVDVMEDRGGAYWLQIGWAVFLACLASLALASVAGATHNGDSRVSGPSELRVGRTVTFQVFDATRSGFCDTYINWDGEEKNDCDQVLLQMASVHGGNGLVIPIDATHAEQADGSWLVSFRVPSFYFRWCSAADNHCSRSNWRDGDRAVVDFCGLNVEGSAVCPSKGATMRTGVSGSLIRQYAPLLVLHPEERYNPMNASTFVRKAQLKYSRRGPDRTISRRPTASRLGSRCSRARGGCYRYGRRTTDDYTRPRDGNSLSNGSVNGFYLDLDNSWRGGRNSRPTTYYRALQVGEKTHITYWLFYGFSRPEIFVGDAIPHEGDWERIVVVLDQNDAPESVIYHQHHDAVMVPWSQVPTVDGHPVVYVARGSHASYSTLGETPTCIRGSSLCANDRRAVGTTVRTWDVGLSSVTGNGWYGFGGAWGKVGLHSDLTGPLGPSRYKR